MPFVPLESDRGAVPGGARLDAAVGARDAFASWAASTLGLPCFLYGPLSGGGTRSLPEVRRSAFSTLEPDTGPPVPHPTAGAVAVGARRVLVAFNLWLDGTDLDVARAVALALRGPSVRALGFDLASGLQVSCNLVDPVGFGPAEAYDRVAALLRTEGRRGEPAGVIRRAELVGLIPADVLERVPPSRWSELDLSSDRTIEARLERRSPVVR